MHNLKNILRKSLIKGNWNIFGFVKSYNFAAMYIQNAIFSSEVTVVLKPTQINIIEHLSNKAVISCPLGRATELVQVIMRAFLRMRLLLVSLFLLVEEAFYQIALFLE